MNRPRPDLVVALAGPASAFARRHRSQLFPDVPLLFAAVDERYLGSEPLGDNEVATAVGQRPSSGRRRHPASAASDDAGLRGEWGRSARQILARCARGGVPAISRPRGPIVWLDGLSLADLERRCASLPPQLRDSLRDVRHRSVGCGICGRASVRGPAGHGERPPVQWTECLPGSGCCRRIDDAGRRDRSALPSTRRLDC